MIDARIEMLGDQALLIRLGDAIDPGLNQRVHALFALIERQRPPWLLDCVPAFASLALFVDTQAWPVWKQPLTEARAWLSSLLDGSSLEPRLDAGGSAPMLEIPVCYASEFALDLDDIVSASGLEREQVADRHTSANYRVAMLGFAAGFPYLLGLDPVLAMPRLATPRTRVPAGSVAIGGAQTGIYPRESPGGWRIIGRTPLPLFDANRDHPALLAPGDAVKFVAIGIEEFAARKASV